MSSTTSLTGALFCTISPTPAMARSSPFAIRVSWTIVASRYTTSAAMISTNAKIIPVPAPIA